jgi:peptide/nickel transport system substrate-binding protein
MTKIRPCVMGCVVLALASGPMQAPAQGPVNPPQLSEPPPADLARIDYEQTLIRRLEGNPNTLNPLFRGSDMEYALWELLYDAPFVFDSQMRWRVNEAVVEKYEESDDHRSATLVLKPGLKWHDGQPFTARDVVFSFHQLRDPQVPAGATEADLETIASCEAVGEYEVRFVHREASPVARVHLVFPIVAEHVFAPVKANDPTLTRSEAAVWANRHPVGNGPYRFVEWTDDERIVLERWDDYPGPKPFFKRIVFRILRDPKTALLVLLKGEIDEMRLTPAQFAAQTASPEFAQVAVAAKAHQWVTNYIGWNADGSNPFFADARVRRTMTHALDVEQILHSVYQDLYSRSLGIYTLDAWMFNPEVKPLRYSLADAGDLLDQAGWTIDPQTGWRTKDGVTFAFELICPQESSTGRQVLTYYQQALRSIGVDLRLRLVEYAASRDLRRRHEFQAYFGSWTASDDPDQDRGMWHSDAIAGGANFVSYRNPRVDALFDAARRTFDFAERQRCYREIHKLIYDDQPFTFVSVSPSLWAFNKHLRGVNFGPRGAFYWHPGPRTWWVLRGEPLRAP